MISDQENIWRPSYKASLKSEFAFELKSFLGRLFKNRSAPTQKSLLNLGNGDSYYEDFVNADFFCGFKFWKKNPRRVDWQLDLRYPLNCTESRWDGVFTEHVLEHLFHDEVLFLLRELERTMAPAAIIRIIVPDLEQCCKDYENKNFVNSNETGARLMWGLSQNWAHKSLWDFELMSEALQLSGFKNIRKCQFSEGEFKALLRDSPNRKNRSLYVEAQKRAN